MNQTRNVLREFDYLQSQAYRIRTKEHFNLEPINEKILQCEQLLREVEENVNKEKKIHKENWKLKTSLDIIKMAYYIMGTFPQEYCFTALFLLRGATEFIYNATDGKVNNKQIYNQLSQLITHLRPSGIKYKENGEIHDNLEISCLLGAVGSKPISDFPELKDKCLDYFNILNFILEQFQTECEYIIKKAAR